MNAFLIISVASFGFVVLFGRHHWLKVVACFLPLLLCSGAVLTMLEGVNRARPEHAEAADRTLGTIRMWFLGLELPVGTKLQFGGDGFASDKSKSSSTNDAAKIAVVVPLGELDEKLLSVESGNIELANRFLGDRIMTARVTTRDFDVSSTDELALKPGMSFCLTRVGASGCADQVDWWEIGPDGQLVVASRQASSEAVRQAACPIPTKGISTNRVFPLATFGRPACRGPAILRLDHLSDDPQVPPFVFLKHRPEGIGLAVAKVVPNGASVFVVGHGHLGTASKQVDTRQHGSPVMDISVRRLDIAPPRSATDEVDNARAVHRQIEIGASSATRVASYRLIEVAGETGKPRIRLIPSQRDTFSIPPSEGCGGTQTIEISASASSPAVFSGRPGFLQDLTQISAQGAKVIIDRGSASYGPFSWRCAGLGPANLKVVDANGAFLIPGSGTVIAIGDESLGRLLFSVMETSMPVASIGLLLLMSCALRTSIRVFNTSKYSAFDVALIAVVDYLLILRLVGGMQEATINPGESNAPRHALLAVVILPIVMEVAVVWRERIGVFLSYLSVSIYGRTKSNSWWHKLPRWTKQFYPVAIPLLHLLLVVSGFRERIGIAGVELRLTTIFVPLYAISFAVLAFKSFPTSAPTTISETMTRAAPFLLWALAGGVAFSLARDSGALFCIFPGLALWMAYVSLHEGRDTDRQRAPRTRAAMLFGVTVFALPLVTYLLLSWLVSMQPLEALSSALRLERASVFAVFFFVLVYFAIFKARTVSRILWLAPGVLAATVLTIGFWGAHAQRVENCPTSPAAALATCLNERSLDHNSLRIAQQLAPGRAAGSISRDAVYMGEVFTELNWLVHEWAGPQGQGFMTIAPRRGLNKYDNAFASHVIGPFGTYTAFFTLAMLAVLMAWSAMRSMRDGLINLRDVQSSTAVTIFCFSSIYIICGNLQWVLFTGRNVYLTTSISISDLVEGGLLVLIALLLGRISDKATAIAKEKVAT